VNQHEKVVFLFVPMAMVISLATSGIGWQGKEAENQHPKVENLPRLQLLLLQSPAGTGGQHPLRLTRSH